MPSLFGLSGRFALLPVDAASISADRDFSATRILLDQIAVSNPTHVALWLDWTSVR
jgi:hypothetical protein